MLFRSRNICPPQAVVGIKQVNIYEALPQCPGLQDVKGWEIRAASLPLGPQDPLCSLLRAALCPGRLGLGSLP